MYEYPCTQPVTAQIRVAAGSVEVVAEQRDSVTVDVQPADRGDGSREAAERTRVEFHDGRLTVESPEATGWLLRRSPRVRVRVRLTLDSSLQLRTASADVDAQGRYSHAAVTTASGDLSLDRVAGDAAANTASGDLRITEVGGALRVNTASGDLKVSLAGGDVTAKSASGDIHIEHAGAGVDATTASGDIHVGSARRGDVRISSASGDVVVGVVAGTGVWLDLSTLSGTTRSELAVDGDTPAAGQNHEMSLRVKTMSGDIVIRRVAAAAAQ